VRDLTDRRCEVGWGRSHEARADWFIVDGRSGRPLLISMLLPAAWLRGATYHVNMVAAFANA